MCGTGKDPQVLGCGEEAPGLCTGQRLVRHCSRNNLTSMWGQDGWEGGGAGRRQVDRWTGGQEAGQGDWRQEVPGGGKDSAK